jgi:hypothetical protein
MSAEEMSREESVRLHKGWWGMCRTCRFWHGTDNINMFVGQPTLVLIRFNDSKCENPKSAQFKQEMDLYGHCKQWDSFDVEVALETMYDQFDHRAALFGGRR